MKKILKLLFGFALVGSLVAGYVWFGIFNKKINITQGDQMYFYIPSTASYEDVLSDLSNQAIVSEGAFSWLADLRHLEGNIYPGRYTLKKGMTYTDLVVFLRSGQIDEVTVTFNNVRTLDELAEKVGAQIEATPQDLIRLFTNADYLRGKGYDVQTLLGVFIPNTYKMYWNTSAKDFIERMLSEHQKFWTQERLKKAAKLNLTSIEVATLASIVNEEQAVVSAEWPKIAGLYINRLKRGQKLESDPTVKYALGDFSIKRILNKDLRVESPYNTYKYVGLPPGPIRVPEPGVIDAVLNYEHHDYIFMCAAPDGSGKHWFAKTYAGHLQNARKYHQMLNERKTYR